MFIVSNFFYFPFCGFSAYSEIQAANSEDHETEALVDQFFRLQDDLSQSRLILQSLAGNTRAKLPETHQEPNEDALRLSSERKKKAQLWVKAALASDLAIPTSTEQAGGYDNMMKGTCISQKLSNHNPKINSRSSDHKHEWSRGSSLCAAGDLENSLQRESRALFLGFLEQYLDGLKRRFSRERNDKIVGTMLQTKRVSDWVDLMAKKEAGSSRISSRPEDPEIDTYGRIKNKIYRILLMHIDKTAMAWENMNEASPH